MLFWKSARLLILAGLQAGLAGIVHAQSTLPLKGTLADDAALSSPAQPEKPIVTSLEVNPLQPDDLPQLRRRAVTEDDYAAPGVGQGGLRLYPSITATAVYSSNANDSPRNARAAAGFRLQPDVRIESDWSRHSWTAGIKGDWINFAGIDNADTATLDLFQRLRLDVRRETKLEAESRYSLDQPDAGEASEQTLSGSLAVLQDFGPMTARVTAGARQKYYGEAKSRAGGTASSANLDYLEPWLGLRTTYNAYGALKPYIETSYNPRFHDQEIDRYGLNRDSTGLALGAGLVVEAGPIWTGEMGLTYLHRNYQSKRLASAEAFGLTGGVTWSPDELTRIVMTAGTALDEDSSANVGAKPTWNASINGIYSIRDNVDLLSGVSVEIEGSGGDKTYEANLGVAWQFNPILSWTAGYDISWLDSARPNGDYMQHRVSTGLTVRH